MQVQQQHQPFTPVPPAPPLVPETRRDENRLQEMLQAQTDFDHRRLRIVGEAAETERLKNQGLAWDSASGQFVGTNPWARERAHQLNADGMTPEDIGGAAEFYSMGSDPMLRVLGRGILGAALSAASLKNREHLPPSTA